MSDRAAELLDAVGLADKLERPSRHLSGGEQQRTAIARALVRSPSLIVADEPTGALDTASADAVLAVLLEAAEVRGAALVLATHDPLVASRAQRVLALQDGVLDLRDVPT